MDNEKLPGTKGMIVDYKSEGDEAEVKDVEAEAETSGAGIPKQNDLAERQTQGARTSP